MPGLIGIVGRQGRDDAASRVIRGRDRLLRRGRGVAEQWIAPDAAMMGVRVRLAGGVEPVDAADPIDLTAPIALLYGVLHNERELRSEVLEGPPAGNGGRAAALDEILTRLYVRHGDEFISKLDGEFAVLVIDPLRRRMLAATDIAGNYPVYWRADGSGLLVATDLGAVLAASAEPGRLHLKAVADYLTCGMVLGDKTLACDVRVLQAGERLSYHADSQHPQLDRYCDPATLFAPKASNKPEYLEAVVASFGRAVSRALGSNGQVGLSLSGGLDSRAILSAAGSRASGLGTYTVGVPGCADEVIGNRLARIAGTRHTFFPLDRRYLHDFLPNMAEMVSLTGGMYLSHGLTEMLALDALDQLQVSILLRGHGGELAKAHLAWPLHTDRHVYRLRSTDELVAYLAGRANYVTPRQPLERILSPEAASLAGSGARDSFRQVLHGKRLSPADACSYLYLSELHRRFTVPSLELLRSRVEVRLPFVDREFLRTLLGAPSEWRDSTDIHRRITASGIAALGRVRDSNTGAPADANPWTLLALEKANGVFRRLGVPGFRHYHNFDAWMRTSLLASVESELMSSTARIRSFVPTSTIEGLLADTRGGRADHSYLLQVLVILELWQREHRIGDAA